ncbi:MAG: hypothetical protein AAF845_06060 [Bacteroidota bacterium]
MARSAYDQSVFVNAPFDPDYAPVFDAVIFAIHDCGFVARCALEEDDSARVRVEKIYAIISECRLGVHDVSRTELDPALGLPRFNMPLELGIFLGARQFGRGRQREKRCLVLDRERFRYQAYLSDISGQDIKAHGDEPARAIRAVRNWLSSFADAMLPGATKMAERYALFLSELPDLLDEVGIERDELIYNEYTTLVVGWQKVNPWG